MAKILVVEDHNATRLTLTRRLSKSGHQVDTVSSGYDGLEKLRQEDYELVLLDFMMKGMNGIHAFEAMKTIRNDLPYIMVTAYAHSGLVKEFMGEGGSDFIVKPFGEDFEKRINLNLERFYGTAA